MVLRHASPGSLILDCNGGDIDAIKISFVNEGESGSVVNGQVVFIPNYLESASLIKCCEKKKVAAFDSNLFKKHFYEM